MKSDDAPSSSKSTPFFDPSTKKRTGSRRGPTPSATFIHQPLKVVTSLYRVTITPPSCTVSTAPSACPAQVTCGSATDWSRARVVAAGR
eukprot:345711-Rhodomonas_salina.1